MRSINMLGILLLLTILLVACGGEDEDVVVPTRISENGDAPAAEPEAQSGDAETTSNDANDSADSNAALITNPFPEPDYENFALTHALTLCDGVTVPFPGGWTTNYWAWSDELADGRCIMTFANDPGAGLQQRDAGQIALQARTIPGWEIDTFQNQEVDPNAYVGMTPREVLDQTISYFSLQTFALTEDDYQELTINGRSAVRVTGLSTRGTDMPDNTLVVTLIDFSTDASPVFVATEARMLTGEEANWMPIIEEWHNAIDDEAVLGDLTYIYGLPTIDVSIPVDGFVADEIDLLMNVGDEPGDRPLGIVITIGPIDQAISAFTLQLQEMPPAEGKSYTLVHDADTSDEVGFRASYIQESGISIFPQDATITLSYDGYVINGEVNGMFVMTADDAPIDGEFEVTLSFTNLPLFPDP